MQCCNCALLLSFLLQSASDITFSCFLVYLCTLRFADDELSTVQYWDVCPPAKWHSLKLRARLNIHSEKCFFYLICILMIRFVLSHVIKRNRKTITCIPLVLSVLCQSGELMHTSLCKFTELRRSHLQCFLKGTVIFTKLALK